MNDRLSLLSTFLAQCRESGVDGWWKDIDIGRDGQAATESNGSWNASLSEMLLVAKQLELPCLEDIRKAWNAWRPSPRARVTLPMDEQSKSRRLDILEGLRQPDDDDLVELAEWAASMTFAPSYQKIMGILINWDIILAAQVVVERSDKVCAEQVARLATSGNPPTAESCLDEWDALVILSNAGLLGQQWANWIAVRSRPEERPPIVMS